LLAAAAVARLKADTPGPVIGNLTEKGQTRRLFYMLDKFQVGTLESHLDDLLAVIMKHPNQSAYANFLEKLGPKSRQPILDLIKSDKRRIRSLSRTMCKLGEDLAGIETPLMEMAERHEIELGGHYGHLVYLMLELGIDENRILNSVNPDSFHAERHTKQIQRKIKKFQSGKYYC